MYTKAEPNPSLHLGYRDPGEQPTELADRAGQVEADIQ